MKRIEALQPGLLSAAALRPPLDGGAGSENDDGRHTRSVAAEMAAGGTGQTLSILMVSARFAPFVGGTEIHTGEVAAELVSRGHRVTVLTTETTGSLPKSEIIDGVTIVRVPAYPRRTDLYIAPGIRKVILDGRWDVVHVQGYHTAVAPVALATAQRAGIPTVLTFHSGGHSSRLRNLIRPAQAWALRPLLLRCHSLIAVSHFEAELFATRLRFGQGRIKVIPNGVSAARPNIVVDRQTEDREDQDSAGGRTILSMGRLVRYKGHHRVIRAMPHILRSNPDARLLILGRGPYEKTLRRLAKSLGVSDRVDFDYVPADERDRLQKIMAEASMAVLLSAYESQGMAAFEAIEAGLPLVVMDKTALSELVSSGHAQAIPPHATHPEVAEIVTRQLNVEADGADRSAIPALATHSWPTIVDRIIEEYRRISVGERRTGDSAI